VKGIGEAYADLLETAGVDTIAELAQRNPANLLNRITAVNAEHGLVVKLPSLTEVEDWIRQAKELPRIVTY
jgi:predicted flap endonuclease-1-like 5' DNA nuclease